MFFNRSRIRLSVLQDVPTCMGMVTSVPPESLEFAFQEKVRQLVFNIFLCISKVFFLLFLLVLICINTKQTLLCFQQCYLYLVNSIDVLLSSSNSSEIN